ncbi:coiled-coil domain-containing protein 50-like [Scyliorhinus canicula]|uniref:coiled-coil domain-containing protein 50-like n=1 Tax=Scyliorhinus canicula TaxID=7830 RepID=UPI0018F3419B|nr:coiled-coil domain-containing protein 50-like [Scyliorhinus canicula]
MEDGEMGLNQVQHVCQKFQILEDQTVAHVLQEQEIHQHLATNKLKTQRVRQNLQVARRLQEEEDERSRQLTQRLCKHTGGEVTGSEDTRRVQGEWDNRHRQPAYREAGSRLRCFASETGQHSDKETTDFVAVKGGEGN